MTRGAFPRACTTATRRSCRTAPSRSLPSRRLGNRRWRCTRSASNGREGPSTPCSASTAPFPARFFPAFAAFQYMGSFCAEIELSRTKSRDLSECRFLNNRLSGIRSTTTWGNSDDNGSFGPCEDISRVPIALRWNQTAQICPRWLDSRSDSRPRCIVVTRFRA